MAHRLVVGGASMGGLAALRVLLGALPADFPLAAGFAEGAYLKIVVGYRR